MKVCLLYEDRERTDEASYHDTASIIQDLGLKALFRDSAKKLIYENGIVKKVEPEDAFLSDTLKKVMMIPLKSENEIAFRQEIMKDAVEHEELIRFLYAKASEVLKKWNELGRGPREKMQQSNPVTKLMTEINVLRLFRDSLSEIKEVLVKEEGLSSKGFTTFRDDFLKAYSDEREAFVTKVLDDISFYTDEIEEDDNEKTYAMRPKIVLECGLEDGLKFSSLKLEEVASTSVRFYRRGSTMEKVQDLFNSRVPDSFSTVKDIKINEQARILEYGVVSYLVERLKSFTDEFQSFFDRLKFQSAFYLAGVQLTHQMKRFKMSVCYPEVCGRRDLEFVDLKEFVMALEQRVDVTGNTCELKDTDLLIVTGANQGGKSTFLRSIGIAQVMMQCGLPVAAASYKSGIFPNIFVHFTRREDSAMNSGRLDEELNRMNTIIERIDEGSLILLNESFATTTEKEGSVIAYDIIRALKEAGVRIFTVTHLLSFARRVHEETKDDPGSGVEFLSAERKEDGTRTYKMIKHAPELTSFGLDLYEEIVEKRGK